MLWCLFFKQKTAYEMRFSDWSSDVCSSDLHAHGIDLGRRLALGGGARGEGVGAHLTDLLGDGGAVRDQHAAVDLVGLVQHRDELADLCGEVGPAGGADRLDLSAVGLAPQESGRASLRDRVVTDV